jgi:hypothetical protein
LDTSCVWNITLLSLVLVYFVPNVYTFKGYGAITENGIELRSRFRTRILQWNDIENIRFEPDLAISHKKTGIVYFHEERILGYSSLIEPERYQSYPSTIL